MMTNKLMIGLIGMVAVILVFGGSLGGEKLPTAVAEEQAVQVKEFAEFKCDPCDYNIDYGEKYHRAEEDTGDEGFAKIECDPSDYNLDYGEKYHPAEK